LHRPCSDAVGPRAGLCAPTDANTIAIAIAIGDSDSHCHGYSYCHGYGYGYGDSYSYTYTDSSGCLPAVAGLLEKSSQCLASE
jgi:hypothetical protein